MLVIVSVDQLHGGFDVVDDKQTFQLPWLKCSQELFV